MLIKYEFNTNSDDYDREEHEKVKQAQEMASALFRIQEELIYWRDHIPPKVDETSHFWNDLTEEEKKFYTEHNEVDIDKMVQEIWDILESAGVNMEKMGY